jgi:hypothetical protein
MKAGLVAGFAALICLASAPAFADVIPDEEAVCGALSEGAKCSLQYYQEDAGTGGVCIPTGCGSNLLFCYTGDGGYTPHCSGGCSLVAGDSSRSWLGAVAIAGSFLSLFLLKRRRSRA